NGEAPVPVVAAKSPSDCFYTAIEAVRIALTYRTPVVLLSDGYLANGSEPWQVPSVDDLPDLRVEFAREPNGPDGEFLPYLRDPGTLARPWAVPGTPGLEHRIGGIEKDDPTGDAKVLVVGWGSTYGPIGAACRRVRRAGLRVAQVHLRHLNPLPRDLGEI